MIEALEVVKFQSHDHTIMDFDPGVNVIKGTSHHGKSAIMRALKWALFNRPKGIGFKSWFAKDSDAVDVSISFQEGAWVSRIRDDENRYLSEGLNLKALRTDVPNEISQITKVTDINFQGQDEKYFLIGDTPGQAGKKLNEIIGLQIIDETRTKINQKISKLKTEFGITEEDLETTREKIKKYQFVDKAEKLVNKVESLSEKRDKQSQVSQNINQTVDMVQANQKLMVDLTGWLQVEKEYLFVTELNHELGEKKVRKDKIFWWKEEIDNQQLVVEEAKDIISLEPDLKNLQEMQKKLIYASNLRSKLLGTCSAIRQSEIVLKNASQSLIGKSERAAELKTQLDYCQICGAERKYWRK